MTLPPVIHADDAIVVVDKPAGLLAVPGRGPEGADCVAARVQAAYPDALIVHRLDMATSGLMVFARGPVVQRTLSIAFAERRVDKAYVAVVHGRVPGTEGHIDLPLLTDWPNRPRQKVDPVQGKPSLTRWQLLAHDEAAGRTRLALFPVTGRSHQLRVHMMSIGHAIVGDTLYASAEVAAASARLLLHASRLQLSHPVSGAALDLRSPPPF